MNVVDNSFFKYLQYTYMMQELHKFSQHLDEIPSTTKLFSHVTFVVCANQCNATIKKLAEDIDTRKQVSIRATEMILLLAVAPIATEMILPPAVASTATCRNYIATGGSTNSHKSDTATGSGTNSHRNDIATGSHTCS